MGSITLEQAALWCGGQIDPKYKDVAFFGANNDTRKIEPGQLFVALQGNKKLLFFYFAAVVIGTEESDVLILGINLSATPGCRLF